MNEKPSPHWPDMLLSYFYAHKRELPWREGNPRDPYAVWVAEIMLQQTRTEAVKPYFTAWKSRFPTVVSLAAADESEVLHQWQGLGYYSRARNLHRAAREIVERYGGEVPQREKELLALPGIGAYTAGAIRSLAFGEKASAVDGNVLRVYARLYGIEEDILQTSVRKRIIALAEATLPSQAGDFNEALMDLGAEICIPKAPRCERCPLRRECVALSKGKERELPLRKKKKPPIETEAACAVCIETGKVWLHLRPAEGMLGSMWEFPMVLGKSADEARRELETFLGGKTGEIFWRHTHVFTHRIWHMKAYVMERFIIPDGAYRLYDSNECRMIPLAGPHARLAARAEILLREDF